MLKATERMVGGKMEDASACLEDMRYRVTKEFRNAATKLRVVRFETSWRTGEIPSE